MFDDLAERGQVDEARALLHGLLDRREWHHSEYRSPLLAQAAMPWKRCA